MLPDNRRQSTVHVCGAARKPSGHLVLEHSLRRYSRGTSNGDAARVYGVLPVQIQIKVEVRFVRDALRGDDSTEVRVRLLEIMPDVAPEDDD